MKKLLEKLLAASFVATIVFATGDTYWNLVATLACAACAACCQWKLNTLTDE